MHRPCQVAATGCDDPAHRGCLQRSPAGNARLRSAAPTYVGPRSRTSISRCPSVHRHGPGAGPVIDRDVILARSDVAADGRARAASTCDLRAIPRGRLQLRRRGRGQPRRAATIRIERGFVGVDATIGGEAYRFVNTHLEVREPAAGNPYSRIVQAAQAYQLLLTMQRHDASRSQAAGGRRHQFRSARRDPASAPPLQLLLGTDVIVPPYMQFRVAQFTDVWTLRPGAEHGRALRWSASPAARTRTSATIKSALVRADRHHLLARAADRRSRTRGCSVNRWPTRPGRRGLGLWPSDHAGLQYWSRVVGRPAVSGRPVSLRDPCSNPPLGPSGRCSTAAGAVAGGHRRRRALRGTAPVRTVAGIRRRDDPCLAHGEALGGTRGGRARRRAAARAGRRGEGPAAAAAGHLRVRRAAARAQGRGLARRARALAAALPGQPHHVQPRRLHALPARVPAGPVRWGLRARGRDRAVATSRNWRRSESASSRTSAGRIARAACPSPRPRRRS